MADAQGEEDEEKERILADCKSTETSAEVTKTSKEDNSQTINNKDLPMERNSNLIERKTGDDSSKKHDLATPPAPHGGVPRTVEERVLLARKMMVLKQKEKQQEMKDSERRALDFLKKLEKEKSRKISEKKRKENERRRDFEDRKRRLLTEENERKKQILEKSSSDVVANHGAGTSKPQYRRRALSLLSGKEPNYTTPTVAYQIRTSRPTSENVHPVTCSRYRSVSPERYRSKSADYRPRRPHQMRSKSSERVPRQTRPKEAMTKVPPRRSKTATPPRNRKPMEKPENLKKNLSGGHHRNMLSLSSLSATTTTKESNSSLLRRETSKPRAAIPREPTPSRPTQSKNTEAHPKNKQPGHAIDGVKESNKLQNKQKNVQSASKKPPPTNSDSQVQRDAKRAKEVKKVKEIKQVKEVKQAKEVKEVKEVKLPKHHASSEMKAQTTTATDAKNDDSCSDDYKAKMLEMRRLARERAKKQAEEDLAKLNKAREEEAEREKDLQAKKEKERQERLEAERLRAEKAQREEKERKKKEEEDKKIKEEELKQKLEQEAKEREEVEAKAREESLQREKERQVKLKKEEEERLARKKKLDLIMKRVKPANEAKLDEVLPSVNNSNSSSNMNQTLVEQAPVQQISVEPLPIKQASVEPLPVEQASVEHAPIKQESVESLPVEQASVEQASTEPAKTLTNSDQNKDMGKKTAPDSGLSEKLSCNENEASDLTASASATASSDARKDELSATTDRRHSDLKSNGPVEGATYVEESKISSSELTSADSSENVKIVSNNSGSEAVKRGLNTDDDDEQQRNNRTPSDSTDQGPDSEKSQCEESVSETSSLLSHASEKDKETDATAAAEATASATGGKENVLDRSDGMESNTCERQSDGSEMSEPFVVREKAVTGSSASSRRDLLIGFSLGSEEQGEKSQGELAQMSLPTPLTMNQSSVCDDDSSSSGLSDVRAPKEFAKPEVAALSDLIVPEIQLQSVWSFDNHAPRSGADLTSATSTGVFKSELSTTDISFSMTSHDKTADATIVNPKFAPTDATRALVNESQQSISSDDAILGTATSGEQLSNGVIVDNKPGDDVTFASQSAAPRLIDFDEVAENLQK